jgi:hypothetical protein
MPEKRFPMVLSQEEASQDALSEDLGRFCAKRRLAIGQFLEAVTNSKNHAHLHELRIEFSIHSARDYAQRALYFQSMLQTLLGTTAANPDPSEAEENYGSKT